MRRFFVMTLAAFAIAVAVAPEAEAGCRSGRVRGWFQGRRAARQDRGGFHPLQRLRDRRGCSTCDASDQLQAPELIAAPAELLPEVRFADAGQE